MPQIIFALLALGVWGGSYWLLLPVFFLLLVVPLLDALTGWKSDFHFNKEDFSAKEVALLNWNPRLYALFYVTAVVYFAMSITRFTIIETGFIIASMSLLGGIGFAAAHELLHGKEKIDQVFQRILTTFLFYPHYKVIHIRSHHVHAGTEHDENTAWLNENFYAYIIRTIPGSAVRSWHLEAKRAGGNRPTALFNVFQNKMSALALGQFGFLLALYLVAGWPGFLFYVAHIVGAHVVLESVNYIQHYGLLRKQNDGEYEKTGAEHSWDTYHFFSSYMTFRVGHHSYHHIAVKPYYLLEAEPEAPKLPVGYFWAIPVVFLPFWWRRITHPRLTPFAQERIRANT